MEEFKMPKLKALKIKPEVLRAIQFHANVNMDRMYTPGIDEDQQCTDYHAFKALCLTKGEIPLQEDVSDGRDGRIMGTIINVKPGIYFIARLHPQVRRRALECAAEVRKMFNIQ